MINFLLIAICILAGVIIKKAGLLGKDAHRSVNVWLLYVATPSVSLKYIPTIDWNFQLIIPILMPVIVLLMSFVFIKLIALKFKMSRQTQAALILTAGLGNTSFVGFPLISAFYGEHEIKHAILCDQMSFIMLATLGLAIAINYSEVHSEKLTIVKLMKKIVALPPFIGFVAALVLPNFIDISPLNGLFDKFAATLVPLALFSVGLQLNFTEVKSELKHLYIGLFYKLILAPSILLGIILAFKQSGITMQITTFEASMAPMITAAIIASEYKLNPKLSNMMVGVGIPLSFITCTIWFFILKLLS